MLIGEELKFFLETLNPPPSPALVEDKQTKLVSLKVEELGEIRLKSNGTYCWLTLTRELNTSRR